MGRSGRVAGPSPQRADGGCRRVGGGVGRGPIPQGRESALRATTAAGTMLLVGDGGAKGSSRRAAARPTDAVGVRGDRWPRAGSLEASDRIGSQEVAPRAGRSALTALIAKG